MSQRKNGREWIPEGPASAAAGDALAVLGRLSTDSLIPQGGAGPVERRQANEAMRAAWRRGALPDLPAVVGSVPPRMTEDELIGAYRSPVDPVIAADEEEEPDMDEPEPAGDPLMRLAAAAEEAAGAREAFEAARIRRNTSVEALRAAWDALGLVAELAPPSPEPPTNTPRIIPAAEPKRRRPGGATERAESIEERAARVLEVLDRHGGDTKSAGVELGMRGNVVARIAQSARARVSKAS